MQCHRFSDGEPAIHNGADDIHTGLGVTGGVAAVEIMGIEVDTAGGNPGLINAGNLAHQRGTVFTGIAQVRLDCHSRLS